MQETPLPPIIQPLIEAYLQALEPLSQHLYGVYVYGSIALGAFEDLESDIDLLVVTRGEWSPLERQQLQTLHRQLCKAFPLGKRLEVFYIPFEYLGILQTDARVETLAPYPVVRDGTFWLSIGEGLNAVTWWILKQQGLCLRGPECSALPLNVTWADVLSTTRYNLDVYYARQIKRPQGYLFDVSFEFAVSNLCRILTTVEEGEIVSKSVALKRWQERVPDRWQPLLEEAWRVRHHLPRPGRYRHRWRRMQETLAFIQYGRERGRKALDRKG
jgi:predicted nucleotidyltransferase